MKSTNLIAGILSLASALIPAPAAAQTQGHGSGHGGHPHLHINNRWEECSFQLDPSLTQAAWRQFDQGAGLVAYFRPLTDAKPMGRGKLEVSLLQWQTGINDNDAAWNDTFVHPDSTHWLFEGSGLKFPGLMVRAGVGDKTDVGVYYTRNPNANYGFAAAQVQQNLVGGATSDWAAAARLSVMSLYGPDDLDLKVLGWDLVASREIDLASWAAVSPYVGVSSYFSMAREKSAVVNLKNEYVGGSQANVGAVLRLSGARLAVEYNAARVNSVSMKVGFGS
jgi:hypothetical protein